MKQPPTPDFDELVGPDVPPAERERLYTAHELLVQAGPETYDEPAFNIHFAFFARTDAQSANARGEKPTRAPAPHSTQLVTCGR